MRRCKRGKLFSGCGGQIKINDWLVRIGLVARIGAADVSPADNWHAAHNDEAAILLASARLAWQYHRVCWKNAVMRLKRSLLGRIALTVVQSFTQFQSCRGLNDLFHS